MAMTDLNSLLLADTNETCKIAHVRNYVYELINGKVLFYNVTMLVVICDDRCSCVPVFLDAEDRDKYLGICILY